MPMRVLVVEGAEWMAGNPGRLAIRHIGASGLDRFVEGVLSGKGLLVVCREMRLSRETGRLMLRMCCDVTFAHGGGPGRLSERQREAARRVYEGRRGVILNAYGVAERTAEPRRHGDTEVARR